MQIIAYLTDQSQQTMADETHKTHRDAPKILSWARSGAVAKLQTGYIMASLAWVRICSGTPF